MYLFCTYLSTVYKNKLILIIYYGNVYIKETTIYRSMETLINIEELVAYHNETNDYVKKKKIDKFFNVIVENVLMNKPDNILTYLYNNIHSFLLNKIFIIGPPFLKITSTLATTIANKFDYYHISITPLIMAYLNSNGESTEDQTDSVLINDDLVCSIMKSTLDNLDAKKKGGYVVEGFPRNNIQTLDCYRWFPTYIIVLYASEQYIYKKYEEENNVTIFSNVPGIRNVKEETEEHMRTFLDEEEEEEPLQVFEVNEIDPSPFREKIQLYERNVSGLIDLVETNNIINLHEYSSNEEVIAYVTEMVAASKDKWKCLFGEDNEKEKESQREETTNTEEPQKEKEKETDNEKRENNDSAYYNL